MGERTSQAADREESIFGSEPQDRTDVLPIGHDDARVVAALEEYLAMKEGMQRPDRAAFLARHAEIAGPLEECLDGLSFVQSAGWPLASPDLDPSGSPAEQEIPPSTCLGGFRILRVVGSGGMGVVYEAEQIALGRRVALKVLPSAASLDPAQRQRFQLEAQAAAHLHHPHIVPVFAVGSERGAHFYAMQFIEGSTLAAVIRDLQQARSGPGPAIRDGAPATPDSSTAGASPRGDDTAAATGASAVAATTEDPGHSGGPPWEPPGESGSGPAFFRAAARLGLQAAEALEHAHGMGVLHRDIKPANLMIDRGGDLWVTDFGLARFQGEDGLTRTGEMVGTLRYMSPEQATARRGVVDQRTDIYSLGITLYELMTLRPAFDGKDRQELLHQIALEEPPAPRGLAATMPRDLETIVLKAIAKDPTHRYTTATALADDLRRFLEDRPILARRPSAGERLARWARRHRTAVATAAAVILIGGAFGSAALAVAYRFAREDNERARQALRKSFAIADALAGDAMGRMEALDADPRSNQFYIGAIDYYREIIALYGDDPEMREMVAAAHHRMGFSQAILRHIKRHPAFVSVDPAVAYRKAIELYEAEVASRRDAPEPRDGLAAALTNLASFQGQSGQLADAEASYRRVVELRRVVAEKPESRSSPMQGLAQTGIADDGRLVMNRLRLARDMARHAAALHGLGRLEESAALVVESGEIWEAVASEARGGSMEARYSAAQFGNGIAVTLEDVDRELAGRILLLARDLDPDDPVLLNNESWRLVKRPGASAEEARRAVDLSLRAVERAPSRWELWNTLGVARIRANDPKGALEALDHGMILHGGGGDPHDWLPQAMALSLVGDRNKARARYEQATEWLARHPREKDLDTVGLLADATRLLRASGVIDPDAKGDARLLIPSTRNDPDGRSPGPGTGLSPRAS